MHRIGRARLESLLASLPAEFTSSELRAICGQWGVKYDTVQRALQRYGMIEMQRVVVMPEGFQGHPERRYRRVIELTTSGKETEGS